MKTKQDENNMNPNQLTTAQLAKLAAETQAVTSGQTAAARVVELVRLDDGRIERREVDPETDRREVARNFAVRSPVAKLRQRLNLSQKAFAAKLKIKTATLRKWEQNVSQPSGAAAALLTIVDKQPEVLQLLEEDD